MLLNGKGTDFLTTTQPVTQYGSDSKRMEASWRPISTKKKLCITADKASFFTNSDKPQFRISPSCLCSPNVALLSGFSAPQSSRPNSHPTFLPGCPGPSTPVSDLIKELPFPPSADVLVGVQGCIPTPPLASPPEPTPHQVSWAQRKSPLPTTLAY